MPTCARPRELTPTFYGCFDWHSDVHGHWLLVRLLRLMPMRRLPRGSRRTRGQFYVRKHRTGELGYLKHPAAPHSSGLWSRLAIAVIG